MGMTKACTNCRFWTPWREVVLSADAPRFIGHCVVLVPIAGYSARPVVQGLTGDDFRCVAFQPAETEERKQA